MVELYDKAVPDSIYTETVYRFTEENDTLIVKTNGPIIGAKKVLSLTVKITEGFGYVLEKYFRYTLEGLSWSEWLSLSEESLKSIDIKKNHFFDIEYKFICKKVETGGQVEFPEFSYVEIEFDYEIPKEPTFYANHFFKKYFSFYNYDSIKWTQNLLQKIYKPGILAKYIERKNNKNWSDEDFIDFWWSFIYVVSLRLTYNSIYSNIYWYPELLKKYLQQKGIFFGPKTKLDECVYLMQYYYDEISKRGSLSVLEDRRGLPENFENVSVRGELLRLIDKEDTDEFLSTIITSSENGWIVGRTFPLFSETDTYKGYIKGYELGEGISDLNSYPLSNPSNYNVVDLKGKKVIHFTSSGGIGDREAIIDKDKLLIIHPGFSYEISLKFSTTSPTVSLIAGARVMDNLGVEIESPFNQTTNLAINSSINIQSKDDVHCVSFAILGKDEFYCEGNDEEYFGKQENSFLKLVYKDKSIVYNGQSVIYNNLLGKRNLQFKNLENLKLLSPFITFKGEEGSDFYIWDIKVRLLDKKTIFISSIQEILLYFRNNNYFYTQEELKDIIQTYLLPFTMNLTLKKYE